MNSALDNPINWSFKVGTLLGVRIRLHLLFLIGGLFVVGHELSNEFSLANLGYGLGSWAMLFVIVLCHEYGHCFGCRAVNGTADQILLWPLGGLAYTSPPHNPRAHLITTLAGPAVNVVFLLAIGAGLLIWKGMAGLPLNPFRPFQASAPITSQLQYWLVTAFTLNLIILLFNLAPVFPLDGGRVLQCVLWRSRSYEVATIIASGVGMVGAILFFVAGIIASEMLLILIAIFGYMMCWQERQLLKSGQLETVNEFGYDFSRGYASLETAERSRPRTTWWQRRRAAKARAREVREAERHEERRRRIDEILEKVHREGLNSLSLREKRLLEDETSRHRADR